MWRSLLSWRRLLYIPTLCGLASLGKIKMVSLCCWTAIVYPRVPAVARMAPRKTSVASAPSHLKRLLVCVRQSYRPKGDVSHALQRPRHSQMPFPCACSSRGPATFFREWMCHAAMSRAFSCNIPARRSLDLMVLIAGVRPPHLHRNLPVSTSTMAAQAPRCCFKASCVFHSQTVPSRG